MSTILSYLSGIKLGLLQWALLSLATVLGGLIIAFRAQGSKLHAAQIQLLLATVNNSDTGKEAAVVKAKASLADALQDYYNSKK